MNERARLTISLCHASGVETLVWLEPWAQEFVLPAYGELKLICWSDDGAADPEPEPEPELEFVGDRIVVYGAGGTRIGVFINGVDQESFSADCAAPDAGALSTREFVGIVFAEHPETRPSGRTPTVKSGNRIIGWLRSLLDRRRG